MYFSLLRSLFLHTDLSCLLSNYLKLQDSFQHFLQSRSSGNKPPQLLFTWKCPTISLTSEGQFCWILDSWLMGFSFSTLNISAHCFWFQSFCWQVCWLFYWGFLLVENHFSLAAVKILSSSLAFNGLIIMCLDVVPLEFILLGVRWTSRLYSCLSSDLGSWGPLFL